MKTISKENIIGTISEGALVVGCVGDLVIAGGQTQAEAQAACEIEAKKYGFKMSDLYFAEVVDDIVEKETPAQVFLKKPRACSFRIEEGLFILMRLEALKTRRSVNQFINHLLHETLVK